MKSIKLTRPQYLAFVSYIENYPPPVGSYIHNGQLLTDKTGAIHMLTVSASLYRKLRQARIIN